MWKACVKYSIFHSENEPLKIPWIIKFDIYDNLCNRNQSITNKKKRVVKFQQSNIETKESNEIQRMYYKKWKESIILSNKVFDFQKKVLKSTLARFRQWPISGVCGLLSSHSATFSVWSSCVSCPVCLVSRAELTGVFLLSSLVWLGGESYLLYV